MKNLLRLLLKTQHHKNRCGPAQTEKGMTLVELLIGAVMAFLIITPMLGFVVDMLNTDRREQVKANTEQDIQSAVDFIAQDLSQAIHIYDNNTTTGIPELTKQKFIPTGVDKTPILVFWKRQQIPNSVPVQPIKTPEECAAQGAQGKCNDTYVLSLVAYYQLIADDPIWCQPSGRPCPTRIARYEIRDGLKDPLTSNYYAKDVTVAQKPDPAFNKSFNLNNAAKEVTDVAKLPNDIYGNPRKPEVLVNYIDHSKVNVPVPDTAECQAALGVTPPTGAGAPAFNLNDLLITDKSTYSFYACVDTAKNIARVTIRGNSLRRLQPNNADYNAKNPAFFPTASVQVQGRGALGK